MIQKRSVEIDGRDERPNGAGMKARPQSETASTQLKGLVSKGGPEVFGKRMEGAPGGKKDKKDKTPKGIMRSAVPLPCPFDVVKLPRVAGQRPQQGTKSCRMGRNSVHPYVHPPHLLTGPQAPLAGPLTL